MANLGVGGAQSRIWACSCPDPTPDGYPPAPFTDACHPWDRSLRRASRMQPPPSRTFQNFAALCFLSGGWSLVTETGRLGKSFDALWLSPWRDRTRSCPALSLCHFPPPPCQAGAWLSTSLRCGWNSRVLGAPVLSMHPLPSPFLLLLTVASWGLFGCLFPMLPTPHACLPVLVFFSQHEGPLST